MKKRILAVVAHPDDEILGCGGTIARLSKEGCEAFVLILGEGITSRDQKRNREKRAKGVVDLKACANKANKIIGVKDLFTCDLPDNRFDSVPLLDVVKLIENIKARIKPEIVYTHYNNDLNIDHRVVYNATLTACRPTNNESVKEIYSFETPSSTEWNYPYAFNPNYFVDVTDTLNKKLMALEAYKSELRKFPHPRSKEAVKNVPRRWGSVSGIGYAEAFEVIRIINEKT